MFFFLYIPVHFSTSNAVNMTVDKTKKKLTLNFKKLIHVSAVYFLVQCIKT